MKNLFKKNIPPSCEYCEIGKQISNDSVICIKFGVTHFKNNCKKFKYNPLKRKPKNFKKTLNLEKKDFTF